MILAAVMPVQINAEETGETAETFEDDAYTITVICHANGGVFDPDKNTFGDVSDDGSTYTYETLVECQLVGGENEGDEIYDHTLDIPPESEGLSRKGYAFDGWYSDEECTEYFDSRREKGYPEETHVYAGWREVWKKGWRQLEKGWKYSIEEGKDYKNGVYKIGKKYYGFNSEGYMVTGWKKFSGKWYYFQSSGAAVTGWKKLSNKWYYFNSSGVMMTGWQKISAKWYYFTSGGAMVTGWKKISGKWYYFTSSGAMKTGWLKLNNKWYYFTSSGAMVTGTRKIGSKTYKFNSSGVCLNP